MVFGSATTANFATPYRTCYVKKIIAGALDLVDQAERQVAAANNTTLTRYVAEPEAVTAIQTLFQDNQINGINVVLTPPQAPR